jgi:hypothetical protein
MIDIPNISGDSLNALIEAEVAKLLEVKMPSLRFVHEVTKETLKLDFDAGRSKPLTVKSPGSKRVSAESKKAAHGWTEMLKSVAQPAQLTRLRAKAIPVDTPAEKISAAYLATTVAALTNWPGQLPWLPEFAEMKAKASVRLDLVNGRWKIFPCVDLEVTGLGDEPPPTASDILTVATASMGYYWEICCDRLALWLIDSGISDMEFIIPVGSGTKPDASHLSPTTMSIH